MKHLTLQHGIVPAFVLTLLATASLSAQTNPQNGPPKVLVIQREYLKPGKSGGLHEKSESAFVRAMAAAKAKSFYFALDSMTGPSRSLFFNPYPSMEAWEKDIQTNRKNSTLSAALDHATNVDGELLTEYDQSALVLREDLSLNLRDLVGVRYMEITQYVAKPGHEREIEEITKMYVDGYKKAAPTGNWATYQLFYGANTGPVYLFITLYKNLAEADAALGQSEAFMKYLGDSGTKKLGELNSSAVASQMTNLFEINPKMSYPDEEIIKGEPTFWKPKPAAPAKKTTPTP